MFTSISTENTGKYRCRAHTSEGILETSALLNVESDEETEAEKRKRKHLFKPKTSKKQQQQQQHKVEYTLADKHEGKDELFNTEVVSF